MHIDMRIGKPLALLVGALTISPVAYMPFVLATAIPQMLHELDHPTLGSDLYRFLSSAVVTLTVVSMLLLVFYVLHLFRSPLPGRDARVPWVIAFLLFGPLAELVYWWRYIWPRNSAATVSV